MNAEIQALANDVKELKSVVAAFVEEMKKDRESNGKYAKKEATGPAKNRGVKKGLFAVGAKVKFLLDSKFVEGAVNSFSGSWVVVKTTEGALVNVRAQSLLSLVGDDAVLEGGAVLEVAAPL